ncbi:MAG: hypothetical protein JNL72_02440 [Flavipsychrobacter sp.]|nr:hypothetical protein [Flavipsychrobacter sp.]
MKSLITHKRERNLFCYLLCLLLCSTGAAQGQVIKTAFTSRLMNDSLLATNNKDFLYNNITLNNTTSDKLTIIVSITAPKGWQLITQPLITIDLNPSENTIIPIRALPNGNNNDANWQQIKVEYRLNNSAEARYDYFYVKVKEFSKFRASLPNANMVMTSHQKNIQVPVYIKNSGNTVSEYTITYKNEFLHLESKALVTVKPGDDTTHRLPIMITDKEWSMLTREEIRITVKDSADLMNLSQSIAKVGHSLKQHASAFLNMPLQLEVGTNYQEGSPIQYYGSVYGSVDLTENDKLSLEYRSKTYAVGQRLDNQIMRAEYHGKHVHAKAGNISELSDFAIDGYGGKLGYSWKDNNNLFDVFAMVKSRVGDTKVFGAHLNYLLNDNIKLKETYTSSFDNVAKVNGHVVDQRAEITLGSNAWVNIKTGVGMEQSTGTLNGGTPSLLMGSSLGYDFQWHTKRVNIQSVINYNSDNYPGIYKGQRIQTHDVRWLYKQVFAGGFYEYNFRKQNYFFDSLLFTNIFNLRTDNYGGRLGWNTKHSNITFSAGRQLQTQSGDFKETVQYDYLNLAMSVFFNRRVFINSNTSIGYNSIVGGADSNKAMIFSSQGTVQLYNVGATFRYDRGPYYYHEYIAYLEGKNNVERIFVSPYVDISLRKNTFNFRAQYNYSVTMPGDMKNSNVLANVTYSNSRRGFDFQCSGIMPLNGAASQMYFNASLRIRLNAPFLPVRKYHNVRLQLFKDHNGNGQMDRDEEPVHGQTMALNDHMFVSNEKGMVELRNAGKGKYKMDFGYSSKLRGWAPSNGIRQEVTIKGSETLPVPYKVSRVLQGQLSLVLDSTSNLKFSLAHIKVLAKDENGVVYSTLTEENGEFYLNVPAGNYIVTLSEAAFDDNFRPAELSQTADMVNNNVKNLHFEIRQKKRTMNIKKK